MSKKQRLDQLAQELFPAYSRSQIQGWIIQGKVIVDGQPVTKAGTMVSADQKIIMNVESPKFVSRAGFKLEKALDHFGIDVTGLTVMDAGLSTGGFTDCLLQRGAKLVFGVDVGYGQVHEKIREDARVKLFEKTNLRFVDQALLGQAVDLVTLDLSFISVLKVIEAVAAILKPNGQLVVLIKPQFEAGKYQVGAGGIIKDPAVHEQVIKTVLAGIEAQGFECVGTIDSPIEGTMGNKEFLAYFKKKSSAPSPKPE